MLIGALSLIRICWLIFKQWRDSDNSCCDENQTGGEKMDTALRASNTPDVGLEIKSPAYADVADAVGDGRYNDASRVGNRGIVIRYTIAYLPWLSQFDFWKTANTHRPLESVVVDEGHDRRDSPFAS
jgi:hypothetical protein